MPPSIPPPGSTNDSSTSSATTTRLPLIRETTTRNPKEFIKAPSDKTIRPTRRTSSAIRNANVTRSGSNVLRNNKKKLLLRRQEPTSGRPPSSSPQQRTNTTVENDSDSSNDIESSQNLFSGSSNLPLDAAGLAPYGGISTVSPYGFYGGAASMMPPAPFMGMGLNTMGVPYLSGLNQIVYNIQSVVFSITQAIQVVGANQEALQHAWESLNQMVDHAVLTFHEMRALESIERECETEEERKRRKRLKALRYAFVFGGGWLAYKLIRRLLFRKRSLQFWQQRQSAPTMFGRNLYGQSNSDGMSMAYPSSTAMSNYSPANNFYGAMSMDYPGYAGNHSAFGSGYY